MNDTVFIENQLEAIMFCIWGQILKPSSFLFQPRIDLLLGSQSESF